MTDFQRLWSTEALFHPLKIWMKHLEPCDLGPCTTGAHVPRYLGVIVQKKMLF